MNIYNYGSKEIRFLIRRKRSLHPNDYGGVLYYNVIETLLIIDKDTTIETFESIEDEEDFVDIVSYLPRLVGRFQDENFLKKVEVLSEKFNDSKYFKYILEDIESARAALDN
jgi:hypothetical protein